MDTTDHIRELYAASYGRLVVQLYGVTGDLQEAQDVVQEAFIKALASPRQLRAKDNPEAWIRKIAVNHARNRWRRRRTLHRILRRTLPPNDMAPADSSADHVALIAAMRALPETQRVALALFYLGDLSVNEVAETLGLPTGTVKARLSRGRQALAALLDESDPPLRQRMRQEISDVRPS